MNFSPVEAIADAVLFEGYILYPYRPSAIKNRRRWNFGTLYPGAFAAAQNPAERSQFRAQVLLEAAPDALLTPCIRFLQLSSGSQSEDAWKQGTARSLALEATPLRELLRGIDHALDLAQPGTEAPRNPLLSEKPRQARFALRAEPLRGNLYRLTASLANETPVPQPASLALEDAQDLAFISAHLLLGIEGGSFLSLLEPAPEFEAEARVCEQDGVFPVLVGEAGDRSRILCSPIILYDYPQVAPESAGDFFDGTEMDEMLTLRVLTLTEEEKAEIRRGDPHARALLARTESLPDEQLARVHGAIRGLRQATGQAAESATQTGVDLIGDPFHPFAERPSLHSVRVFGIDLRAGDRVRLWPQKKADILDIAMQGKVAIVESIEQDLEDNVQLAVVLEDDPGRDMGMLRQVAHRFFFTPEEVEPLGLERP